MRTLWPCWIVALSLGGARPAAAQGIVLEPDHYPRGTVLDRIVPEVRLTSVGANNLPIPPTPFPITAAGVPPGSSSTGTNVFAQAGVNFFNHNTRLRMDFAGLVQTLSLDAIGSGFNLAPERGHLEAYDAHNVLIDSFVTDILGRGQVQTMAIDRPQPDIAWAVAWSEDNTFARLDHLVFSVPTPIPEPTAGSFLGVGLVLTALAVRSRRHRPGG